MLYTSTRNNYIILLYYIYIYIFISNIYYIIFIFIVLLVPERKKSWKQPFLLRTHSFYKTYSKYPFLDRI